MEFILHPEIHMWAVFLLVVGAFYLYASERFSIETTSILIVVVLLLWGQIFPLQASDTDNRLHYTRILAGFANPYLFAVLGLMVVAQGLVQTSVLSPIVGFFNRHVSERFIFPLLVFLFILLMLLSAFLNNTPLVVMAIPLVQAMSVKFKNLPFHTLMMLSFMSILGGMTTVLGSSTNMLVANALEAASYKPFGIFDFVVPGSIMAAVGLAYVLFIMPFLLKTPGKEELDVDIYREFITDLPVDEKSRFHDTDIEKGVVQKDKDLHLHFLTRGMVRFYNHFDAWKILNGDVMTVSGSRDHIIEVLTKEGVLDVASGDHAVAEIMIPPGSKYVDTLVEFLDFKDKLGCNVIAVQRHTRQVRSVLRGMRISGGDVILVVGTQDAIKALSTSPDIVPIADSKTDVSYTAKSRIATVIFVLTIAAAVTGTLPITVSALTGAALMLLTKCLNVRQMMRALDRKIYFLIGASLAMGYAIEATGGAYFIGQKMTTLPLLDTPLAAATALFVMTAIATNIISNNATAVIFTPIALSVASMVQADPYVLALAVLFGSNCSFASPIGYKTNLLVMGPGHYRFNDFMKAGIPLVVIMCITYAILGVYYFRL